MDGGPLLPDGRLTLRVKAGWYMVQLDGTPPGCTVETPNPTDIFAVHAGTTVDLAVPVRCGS